MLRSIAAAVVVLCALPAFAGDKVSTHECKKDGKVVAKTKKECAKDGAQWEKKPEAKAPAK